MHLSRFLFDPGLLGITPGARDALEESGQRAADFIERHICGDWGELRSEEAAANVLALAIGGELFSRYRTARGDALVVTTEADRSRTYICLDNRPTEGETMEQSSVRPDRLFGSFTTAVGFALGELLLLSGTPDDLPEHLREIHVTARATIICAEAGSEPVTIRRPEVTLSDAALKAVRAWSADSQDPADLDDAMALLSEILAEMGLLQDVADQE